MMMERRIAVVFDEDYTPEGSYAYDTPEETREAEQAERAKLDSGEWAAYGVIVYRPCDDDLDHGPECPHAEHLASVWGTVTDSGHEGDHYGSPDQIQENHLRELAESLWAESDPSRNRPEGYEWVTPDMFRTKLFELIDRQKASVLMASVPGVYELLSEHFNNDVLAELETERPE